MIQKKNQTSNVVGEFISQDFIARSTTGQLIPAEVMAQTIELMNATMVQSIELMNKVTARMSTVQMLAEASEASGKDVILDPRLAYLPTLITKTGSRVFLFDFVETLDDLLDYDEVLQELPGLSYAQIANAIRFLRKVSQFNIRGIDLDELEDDDLEGSEEFQAILLKAISNPGELNVLTAE